jgi:hypothetical protein
MNHELNRRGRLSVVVIYAIAMAWVEAAVVFYLRTMLDRIEPHQPRPLPMIGGLGRAEMVREAATLVMLVAIGTLAGRRWRDRLGYTAMAFGFWDIFYYVFLKVLCGWPHSLLDWDILFLLPLPWWGPVLAPVLISILMIIWGTLVSSEDRTSYNSAAEIKVWLVNFCGIVVALYVFMADSLRVAGQGAEALRNMLPEQFNWPWFCLALLLMSAPPLLALRRLRLRIPSQDPVAQFPIAVGVPEPIARISGPSQIKESSTVGPLESC